MYNDGCVVNNEKISSQKNIQSSNCKYVFTTKTEQEA